MKDYKILLALGNTIGDSVCFTPALHALKQINPNFCLSVLTQSSQVAEIFSYDPVVDQVICSPSKEQFKEITSTHDFVIAFPFASENHYVLKRLGLKTFYPGYYYKPHAECALDLVKFLFPGNDHLGVTQYYLFPQHKHLDNAKRLLLEHKNKITEDSILIGCHLGYSGLAAKTKSWFQRVIKKKYGSRVWPPLNYVELLKSLLQFNPEIRLVFIGTAFEKKLINKFFKSQKHAVIDLCDKTSLLTMAEIMRQFDYFISGDSGPLHFASAANVPMLSLYSESTGYISQPYPPADFKQIIVKPKISDIKVKEVVEKMILLMKQFPPK